MSSLQSQLAAIAASSTHQLDLKAQRAAHAKSLLYDSNVAASQDFDTIYQICAEGFQEICNLDHAFAAFGRTLFSEQSKSEERAHMTAGENEKLDEVLERFLRLVSGRLLLRPAQKTVEWLVRRFRIHEYNTTCTILAFLPYHETPIFTTLLSILPSKLPHSFRFLHPYVASLANPPRSIIAHTASTTPSLLTALNRFVLNAVKQHSHSRALLSFWASVVTQALGGMINLGRSGRINVQKQKEEETLMAVVPILNEGLSYRHSPEMIIACHMIIILLVGKISLDDKILDAFFEAVTRSRDLDTEETCLVCLAVIAQERSHARLSKGAYRLLAKVPEVDMKIVALKCECRVDKLALGYALGVIDNLEGSDAEQTTALQRLLESHTLTADQTKLVFKCLIRAAVQSSHCEQLERNGVPQLLYQTSQDEELALIISSALSEEDVELESLESALGQVLALPLRDQEMGVIDEDTDMQDRTEETSGGSAFESMLTAMEKTKLSPKSPSFLDSANSPTFDELSRIYRRAVAEKKAERVIELTVLGKGEVLKRPTFLSFLLACGTTSLPTAVKTAAWKSISSALADNTESVDFQALVPYVVCGLGDPSVTVRRATAECMVSIDRITKDVKQGKSPFLWGKELYGSSSKGLESLAVEELAKVLSSFFIPHLEESVLDQSHIFKALSSALAGQTPDADESHTKKELKTSIRLGLTNFLASHAAKTPLLSVRLRLLNVMSNVGKKASHARSAQLVPAVSQWFSLTKSEVQDWLAQENIEESAVDTAHLDVLYLREGDSMQLLKSLLAEETTGEGRQNRRAAIEYLTARWKDVKSSSQHSLALYLLELYITLLEPNTPAEEAADVAGILRSVALRPEVLAAFLQKIPSSTRMPHDPPSAKRRRTSRSETARSEKISPADLAANLKLLTLILEIVDSSNKDGQVDLLRGLFHTLGELQHYRAQSNSSMVYLQSLTISSLLAVVKSSINRGPSEFDTSVIRADLLVDCIRQTPSLQVQKSALLLISHLAAWLPETVLHSVMPIFTFMGSTLLRQGDDYSAHVVDQTISRVVPPLASSLRKKNRHFVLGVSELLLSFTAAFEHISSHRRLELFGQLVRTLSAGDSLAPTMALLFDRHPVDQSVRRFVPELLRVFDPITWLGAIKEVFNLIEDGLKPRTKRQLADTLFGFADKNPEEIETALGYLISNIAITMENAQLQTSVSKLLREDSGKSASARTALSSLIEATIRLTESVRSRDALVEPAKTAVIGSLHLPPSVELIKAAQELIVRPDEEIQRIVLQAVRTRAKQVKQSETSTVKECIEFVPLVMQTITTSPSTDVRLTAIACVDQLCVAFGKKDPELVMRVGEVISGPQALGADDELLRTASLNCLTSLVEVVKENFVPLVPSTLSTTFSHLEQGLARASMSAGLHDAAYAFMDAILEHLSFIFSAQNLKTALELSHSSTKLFSSQRYVEGRRQFYLLFSTLVGASLRLQALDVTWDSAISNGPSALAEQAEALHMVVKTSSKAEIVRHSDVCVKILLQGFDLRREAQSGEYAELYTASDVELTEQKMTTVALAMIMKLNDATFRPFFIRMVDWASKSLPKTDRQGQDARGISMAVFFAAFFDRLQSIVTSYSGYVIDFAAQVLSRDAKSANLPLTVAILRALTASFNHDSDDFWSSPSHFTAISAPLVSIIAHKQRTVEGAESTLASEHLIPTITALASAVPSSDLHKELNARIMDCLRADEPRTRLTAVKCEIALTEALGEEWLTLLPEMLPIIAELQEDDDEQVETETQRWIMRIEEILGESLEGMLQ